jgi:DNA polymerase I-like protein with 3'-5' exonuclease and polymerase domains
MDILTIDFETYYAKDYGLRKLTTEEYIRDPRFEVIGVAIKKIGAELSSGNANAPVWFSGSKKQTAKFLAQFDWDNSIALAHNAMFDMSILNWHFGIKPKKIADTLAMARAIHSIEVGGSLAALSEYYELGVKGTEVHDAIGKKRLDFTTEELEAYGGYCIQDAELTYKLFQVLNKDFPNFELALIDLTIRMFSEPVLVLDKEILAGHLKQIKHTKQALMDKVVHEKTKLTSNPQFAELLRSYDIEPPLKISPATGKETYAFAKSDEAFKALQEHGNPEVQALVAARLGVRSTIEETRTQRFIDIANRGTLPIPLRYYAAHTGRWGGDDKINMQNLPRGSQLKKAMCAPDGYKFIDCDLSQIEARTLAWLAEETDLVEAFDRGDDVYKIMASAIYDKPESEITKKERFVGKTTILGAGYGMGHVKFRAQLATFNVELSEEECERIIRVYRETYPRILLCGERLTRR